MLVVQTLQKSDASLGLVQAVLSAGGILGGVLAGTVFVRHPIRSGTGLLLALSGVCAALGLALRVPTLQFGSILVLGAVFMTVAALFNVWFFAQLQMLVPQAQLGKTTACISVLACLTQPIGRQPMAVPSSTGLRTRQMYCWQPGCFRRWFSGCCKRAVPPDAAKKEPLLQPLLWFAYSGSFAGSR